MSKYEIVRGVPATDTGRLWRGVENARLHPLLERCEAMLAKLRQGGDEWYDLIASRGIDESDAAALLADLRKELEGAA